MILTVGRSQVFLHICDPQLHCAFDKLAALEHLRDETKGEEKRRERGRSKGQREREGMKVTKEGREGG